MIVILIGFCYQLVDLWSASFGWFPISQGARGLIFKFLPVYFRNLPQQFKFLSDDQVACFLSIYLIFVPKNLNLPCSERFLK